MNTLKSKIHTIRGKQVMLDRDLAELYGVSTRALNQAVKRNIERFPEDFMFQLNKCEFNNWMSQFVTSNSIRMGLRKLPFAFTEQGVSMLSGVLRSQKAITLIYYRFFIKLMEIFLNTRYITIYNDSKSITLSKVRFYFNGRRCNSELFRLSYKNGAMEESSQKNAISDI